MNPSAIDLRLLRSFINTARFGSVTKAADALRLTQPALSQHLRDLTELIGVPLFDRVGRGVVLTQNGTDLFRELEPLLQRLEILLTTVKDKSKEVRGAMRVGAIDTYARSLVVPAVADLLERHPLLTIEIQELPAPDIDRGILSGEIDIGVAFSRLSSADIEQTTLFEERLMLISRAKRRNATARTASAREVSTIKLALLNTSFAMRKQIDTSFANAGLPLDVRAEAANVDSLVRLVQASSLSSIVSGLAVVGNSRVDVRPITSTDLKRTAALRWRRGRSFSPAVQEFNAALLSQIKKATPRFAVGSLSQHPLIIR
jgi:LysR family cyn operon transcriptional activator